MFHGFSRTTLNVVIIVCLLTIAWIQLTTPADEDQPLEPLALPQLSGNEWQRGTSMEGVIVSWQTLAAQDLRIVIKGPDEYSASFYIATDHWADGLSGLLAEVPPQQAVTMSLQGPLSSAEFQAAAAYLISSAQLTKLPENTLLSSLSYECQLEYPAGALWWNKQQGLDWASPASTSNLPLPTRKEWQVFRQQTAQELRHDWLNANRAIDIQTELAYHRWPETYIQHLFVDLGQAQKHAPQDFAECLSHNRGRTLD